MTATRCLDAGALARLVTTGAEEPHLTECLPCRRRFEADTAARAAIRELPTPVLRADHKRSLAAELIARAQAEPEPAPARRRWPIIASSIAALAAAAALVAAWPSRTAVVSPEAPETSATWIAEDTAMSVAAVAQIELPPALSAPSLEASRGAVLSHAVGAERDTVVLTDGTLALDTRSSRGVDVRVGDTVVRVEDASVTIRAHKQAIVSVQVIVGAARIDGFDQHVTLQRDSIWLPGPTAQQRSLTAFRDGWLALRAGKHREAMALFDQVTDPVAREEASYWAAIAAQRSGDAALAAARLEKFLREYPASEYAAGLADDHDR